MSPVDINKAIYWYQTDFFRLDSSSNQRLKVGLPLHSAPQPLLEASVMTTFLLCAVSKICPALARGGPSNGPGLIHRSKSTLCCGQGQSKREDLLLIRHPLEWESQELSVMGGYLDMKVSVFGSSCWHLWFPTRMSNLDSSDQRTLFYFETVHFKWALAHRTRLRFWTMFTYGFLFAW